DLEHAVETVVAPHNANLDSPVAQPAELLDHELRGAIRVRAPLVRHDLSAAGDERSEGWDSAPQVLVVAELRIRHLAHVSEGKRALGEGVEAHVGHQPALGKLDRPVDAFGGIGRSTSNADGLCAHRLSLASSAWPV